MIKLPPPGPDVLRPGIGTVPRLADGVAAGALPGALPRAPIRIEHTDKDGTTLLNARFPVADATQKIRDLLKDEPPDSQRKILEELEKKFSTRRAVVKNELRQANSELADLEKQKRELEAFQAATLELLRWQKAGLRMERPTGSVMHHLLDALAEKRVRLLFAEAGGSDVSLRASTLVGQGTHAFLVEHDWAGVFEKAADFAGEDFRLPYDSMCFEFRISGKNICVMITYNGERKLMVPFVDSDHGWVLPKFAYLQTGADSWKPTISNFKAGDTDEYEPLRALICGQIRAACISLEAKATVTEIIRASHKLNRSREKRGRAPIADYHVIKLAHRFRALPRPDSGDGEPWARKRLHFRRGHDRHYPTYKIWIRWMLVGDPDLGFVDKEYRL